MAKRFWLGMDHRNALKRTDKIMVGNIDNQAAEYIDLSELLAALTSDDLPEGAARLFLTPTLKAKLEGLGGSNYTLVQLAQYFYPVNTNPEGFLTSASGLAAAKIVGALAVAQIPGLDAGKIISGILAAARIPDLPASKVTSGEFAVARIPVLPASKFEGIAVELGKYILKTAIGTANGVAGLDANVKLPVGYIPNMDAAKITTGVFPEGRIPDVYVRLTQLVDYYSKTETQAFTGDEKNKLAAIEDAKWKGNYPTAEALRVDYPEGAGQVWHQDKGGWIGDVDAGVSADVTRYIWDASDLKWVIQAGASTSETAASIKTKYESNIDTNAFTDGLLDKLNSITAIFTTALKASYDSASSWVSTNGANVLAHVTKFTNNTAGQIPVSQADGSIVWEAKPIGGTVDTSNLAKLDSENVFSQNQTISGNNNKAEITLMATNNTDGNNLTIKAIRDISYRMFVEIWARDVLVMKYSTLGNAIEFCSTPVGLVGTTSRNSYTKQQIISAISNVSLILTAETQDAEQSLKVKSNSWCEIDLQPRGSGRGLRIIANSSTSQDRTAHFVLKGLEFITFKRAGITLGDNISFNNVEIKGLGKMNLSELGNYSDDAAASSAGVAIGYAYINSATGAVHRRLT